MALTLHACTQRFEQSHDIEGLEVLNLGRIELSKGFWNEKLVFPVGYRARRTYWWVDH